MASSSGGKLTGGGRSMMDDMVGVSDMVLLDPMTEDAMIENLWDRYNSKDIYTYIGNVVVSINPYRKFNLYTREVISEYRSRNIYELPPHIYAIADDAYRSMRDHNKDQCILITGESGSGKTEASKIVMQYVAAVSGKGREVDRVKEQLLQSNPVLEAFGNAKTLRNDNSSRFGKYMDIEFDFKGDPVGGVITNYLLEKSRVIHQANGERGFHIFYQLLTGASDELLGQLRLERNFDTFHYLNQSECFQVETISDQQDFAVVEKAMEVIGFSSEEVLAVYQLLSAILNLGNIEFVEYTTSGGIEAVSIARESERAESKAVSSHSKRRRRASVVSDDSSKVLDNSCKMLEADSKLLQKALTERTVETKFEVVATALNAVQAVYARDALCKAIYNKMFNWIVHRINDSIRVKKRGKRKVIGVLDIYGFEIFLENSFEQFIINYCNEKLQQIFIELTLQSEQEEYVREGIEWTPIDYFNNTVICDLIEKPNEGIIAMLDEECLRPGDVSDETFLAKLNRHCIDHPHYESRASKKFLSDATLPHDSFRLRHYAGSVTYKVDGFMDKNNDLLFRNLSQCMYACDHSLLKTLFPEGCPTKASRKRPPTAGNQFKVSVAELMKNLHTKNPNYIRCIKPNDKKKAGLFDERLIRHQARYLGLLENVRVRRAGFAYRQEYDQALQRYKMLCPKTWPNWRGMPRDGVKELLRSLNIKPDEYAYGRTKIFIRNPRTLFDIEEQRKLKMEDLAVIIQKIFRGWRQRTRYQEMKRSEILIAKYYRGYRDHKRYQAMRNSAILISSYARGWKARKLYKALLYEKKCIWAQGIIRTYFIGWQARKLYRAMQYEKKCNMAASIIRAYFIGYKARKLYQAMQYEKKCNMAASIIRAYFIGYKARKLYRAMQYEKKCNMAASIIRAYFIGYKVRKQYNAKFRRNAAPKIIKFLKQFLAFRYVTSLIKNLPSQSPTETYWPSSPSRFRTTNMTLKTMYHHWRCKKYRDSITPERKKVFKEKLQASEVFRDKKVTYPDSVPVPFKGDHINLPANPKWQKTSKDLKSQKIIWADAVQKINRKDGKAVPHILAITEADFLVLDQKSVGIKFRMGLGDISRVSASPLKDGLVVFHIRTENMDKNHNKGDYVFQTSHVIELVAKLLVHIESSNDMVFPVYVVDQIPVNFNGSVVEMHLKASEEQLDEPLCKRKGSHLSVLV